jgi:sugar lactone lactonase YvrE
MSPKLLVGCRNLLGEGPLWDGRRGVLWWVDILARELWRWDSGSGRASGRALPLQATALGLRAAGDLVMAAREGVGVFDVEAWRFDPRVQPEPERSANRSNDGHVGADGAFWFGTMHEAGAEDSGALYRLDPGWRCTRAVDSWGIANTMLTNARGDVLYAADSKAGAMHAFDIHAASLGNRRILFEAGAAGWTPDGSALDAEGCLWNARWDGWAIARVSPQGETLALIDMPVQRPTSCAFGGADLRTLFITSSRADLDDAALGAQPDAGGVFCVDVGVQGLAPFVFQG